MCLAAAGLTITNWLVGNHESTKVRCHSVARAATWPGIMGRVYGEAVRDSYLNVILPHLGKAHNGNEYQRSYTAAMSRLSSHQVMISEKRGNKECRGISTRGVIRAVCIFRRNVTSEIRTVRTCPEHRDSYLIVGHIYRRSVLNEVTNQPRWRSADDNVTMSCTVINGSILCHQNHFAILLILSCVLLTLPRSVTLSLHDIGR